MAGMRAAHSGWPSLSCSVPAAVAYTILWVLSFILSSCASVVAFTAGRLRLGGESVTAFVHDWPCTCRLYNVQDCSNLKDQVATPCAACLAPVLISRDLTTDVERLNACLKRIKWFSELPNYFRDSRFLTLAAAGRSPAGAHGFIALW